MVYLNSKPPVHDHPTKHQTQNIVQQPGKFCPPAFVQLQQANRPDRKIREGMAKKTQRKTST